MFRVHRQLSALAAAGLLGVAALAPSVALATDGGSASVYWDRPACLGTETTGAAGSVTFNRDGKWLSGNVSLSNVPNDGTYGMLVFFLNNGTCPQGKAIFLGQVTVSGGSGSAGFDPIKILGNRDGNGVTVVLCVGNPTETHFSDPVRLGP
jgi:hypothetical protein